MVMRWREKMRPFKLVSREYKENDTIIEIKTDSEPVFIGQGFCTIIAGPCAVENQESYLKIAEFLKREGAHILRGSLFKPRTSPYSFKGLGIKGLDILLEARERTGLPIITEIMDIRDLTDIGPYVDILQVGSRNMQNYTLLEELGKINQPVMLKRGLSATIEEWLLAAEYIVRGGNEKVILCERGIRSFETYTRNTVDIGAVPLVKELSHLPIIVDPSHATGRWQMVAPIARAAIAAGADGIMAEVHHQPDIALSDGKQSLNFDNYLSMYKDIIQLAGLYNKVIK
jgi:3-deoxy-7-phosphoheptulonate synthase